MTRDRALELAIAALRHQHGCRDLSSRTRSELWPDVVEAIAVLEEERQQIREDRERSRTRGDLDLRQVAGSA